MSAYQALAENGITIRPSGPAEQRVACPRCDHGARDDALGVNIETGVFHCFRCGWAGRAGTERGADAHQIVGINDTAVAVRTLKRLARVWGESVPLEKPEAHPVRQYIRARGLGEILQSPPGVLRAHPGLEYWDGARIIGRFPAMLATLMGSDDKPATIHATYLRSDGTTKASVPAPRKILGVPVRGATRGGAIRLQAPRDGVLGVAEGIESALSLHLLQRVPVWAAFCADNLERVKLPSSLRELYIGVDLDESGKGQQVSRALASRVSASGHRPKVFLVEPGGAAPRDLNDELLQRSSR